MSDTTTTTKPSVEGSILEYLNTSKEGAIADSLPFSETLKLNHQVVVGTLKSLAADGYVVLEDLTLSYYAITVEGHHIMEHGSPEYQVFQVITKAEKLTLKELQETLDAQIAKVGMANCMKNKWIKKDGEYLIPNATTTEVKDTVKDHLVALKQAEGKVDTLADKLAKDLKKRKLISLVTQKSLKATKGPDFSPIRIKKAADITKEMLDSGAYKTTPFKEYNFKAVGEKVGGGYLHPLLKVRAEFRKILLEMGFTEMPTNKWVETSFWNFDSLFQPQSHPARDAHDTFFIKEPAETVSIPAEYYERVKDMHETGGTCGSIGYRYDFQRSETRKNLLRTHTTAISSQMLYKLANQPGGFQPAKYFSIDRVFRNETIDATHLCEFHQVEGLVADYNLSLGDLIGTIETFFNKIGITQLRFKPAFNPYTEPSMEIFGYHPGLKKWTEIGNSGMFRPEMLAPMGLPENVRVIAWGLSLERPTMIKYKVQDIRTLFGHTVDMARIKTAPVCRF